MKKILLLFPIFIATRLYAAFSLPLGFDEGFYSYLSYLTINHTPYIDFFDGKPPGIFLLGSIFLRFSSNIFLLRGVSIVAGVLTLYLIIYFCKRFISARSAFFAGLLFTFDPFLLLNSTYYITENFFVPFILLSVVFFFLSLDNIRHSYRYLLFSGLSLGIAAVFKQNALIMIPFLLFVETLDFFQKLLIHHYPLNTLTKNSFIRIIFLIGGFSIVVVPVLLWFLTQFGFQNTGMILIKSNSWNMTQAVPNFLRSRLDIVIGLFTFSSITLILALIGVVYTFRRKLTLYLFLWTSLLFVYIALVLHGWTYMFLPVYLPLIILAAIGLQNVVDELETRFKIKKINLILLCLLLLFFGFVGKQLTSYSFVNFIISPSKVFMLALILFILGSTRRFSYARLAGLGLIIFSLTLFSVNSFNLVTRTMDNNRVLLNDQRLVSSYISERTQSTELVYTTNPGISLLSRRNSMAIPVVYEGMGTVFYGLPNYLEHGQVIVDLVKAIKDNHIRVLLLTDDNYEREIIANMREVLVNDFHLEKRVGNNDIYIKNETY